jgi:plasmid stabilization system protein ParE
MKVIWSSTAIEDLKDLRAFIGQDDPAAAEATARKILDSVEQLMRVPGLGRPGRVPGTRELPGTSALALTGTPYVLPYTVVRQEIRIAAVLHGVRNCPESLA